MTRRCAHACFSGRGSERPLLSDQRGLYVPKLILLVVFALALIGGVRVLAEKNADKMECTGDQVLALGSAPGCGGSAEGPPPPPAPPPVQPGRGPIALTESAQVGDTPWYGDVGDAVWDFGAGMVTGIAGLAGLHGDDGWVGEGDSHWTDNIGTAWSGLAREAGNLTGMHGDEGWVWQECGFADQGCGYQANASNIVDGWWNLAKGFVASDEWSDRPAYAATTTALNVGTLGVGALVRRLLTRRSNGDDDRDGNDDVDDDDGPPTGGDPDNWTDHVLRVNGFAQNPEYGRMAEAAVAHATRQLGQGNLTTQELMDYLAAERRDMARQLGDLNTLQFGLARDPRVPAASITPLGRRYGGYYDGRLPGNRPSFNPDNPYQDAPTRTLPDGTEVRLTTFTEDKIVHAPPESIRPILDHVDDLESRLANAATNAERIEIAGQMHWWLAQSMPYYRGSAAISDMTIRSILRSHGIDLGPYREGVAPNLEAFWVDDPIEFGRRYGDLFEQ